MKNAPLPHLTSDDLDALLAGAASGEVHSHLSLCATCRALAANDSTLISRLAAVPHFRPSATFADRIMERVRVEKPSFVRSILLPLRSHPRAWAAGALVGIGIAASVAWSLPNRDLLQAWGAQVVALLDGWLWLGLRTLAANVTAEPWFIALRDALGSPVRVTLAGVAFVVAYGGGLFALRRLVALPSRPVPHVA